MTVPIKHRARWPRWGWLLLALGVLAVGGYVWWSAASADAAPAWLTAPVQRTDLEDTVLATGTIRAARMVNVGAQATGQVKALRVQVGDKVKAGQLIAEIDATTQQNALRDDLAALASLKAQRASRQAALTHARLALERQQTMMARDATSKAELQAAQNQLAAAEADLKANEMQLQQAGIKIETSRANLGYTRIVAPMDGTVVAVVTEQGQTVNSAMSSPTIVKLAKLDVVQIEAQISEADVTRLKPGMPAWFTLLGEPDKRYPTELKSIDLIPADQAKDTGGAVPATTGGTGAVYYNGVLQADNPDGHLRVSMTAQVHIVAASAPQALVVPAAALGAQDADGRYAVRVLVGEGRAEQVQTRAVRVGLNTRVQAQVLDGLQEGERVVIGQAKTPAEREAEGAASGEGM
ncbi:MAG: efflux RND transporter periplasmic adaptor subunit [Pseudomonadota bacterium]|nr:efflux RND transporter periplasmic adaptor subunit [Pseudomonadota bacterium]